jgi:hypothetical protein
LFSGQASFAQSVNDSVQLNQNQSEITKQLDSDSISGNTTVNVETNISKSIKNKKKFRPFGFVSRGYNNFKNSPITTKATVFSIIPGAGQIYCGDYLHAAGAVLVVGATTYLAIDYRNQYLAYKEAGDSSNEDIARSSMERYMIYAVITYIAQIIDASVVAHLKDFEVNEDLSMSIRPELISPELGNTNAFHPGITVNLNF